MLMCPQSEIGLRAKNQIFSKALEKWCRLGDLNTRPPHYECT